MRVEITDKYLKSLVIEDDECKFDEEHGHWKIYRWIKIADDIDMHIKLSYNELYNYYDLSIHEYIRGYHAGHSQLETKVRYIDELEIALGIMGYRFKTDTKINNVIVYISVNKN